jgi:hypothetical protein
MKKCLSKNLMNAAPFLLMDDSMERAVELAIHHWNEIKYHVAILLENLVSEAGTTSTIDVTTSLEDMKKVHSKLNGLLSAIRVELYDCHEELKLEHEIALLQKELEEKSALARRCIDFLEHWKEMLNLLGHQSFPSINQEKGGLIS